MVVQKTSTRSTTSQNSTFPPVAGQPSGTVTRGTAPSVPLARGPSGGAGSSGTYRYLILPGNESVLLREALERRPWWTAVPEGPTTSVGPQSQSQSLRKKGSGRNEEGAAAASTTGQRQQQWNLWAGLNGQRFTQWEVLQPLGAVAGAVGDTTVPATRHLVNRLQEHGVVCTKSGLAGVLASIQAAAGAPSAAASTTTQAATPGTAAADAPARWDTTWIPETYVVPAGPQALGAGGAELSRFKAAFMRHAAAGRRVWISKPTSLNRGNGIEVFDSLERILHHVRSRSAGSCLILQKYIECPMLLGGRKFDIRAYVLVAPDDTVWFHKEAYCRTSSTPYDSNDLTNRSAHLTNDAVQKHLESYNDFEDHCKMSLEELGPALLRNLQADTPTVTPTPAIATTSTTRTTTTAAIPLATSSSCTAYTGSASSPSFTTVATTTISSVLTALDTRPGSETGIWGAMRRCVAALFSAVQVPRLLNPRRLGYCFELLGLDFMLDDQGGLYLIEVNTSPALFRAGCYLTDLLPRLVEEVVQKAVDPLFPPFAESSAVVRSQVGAEDEAADQAKLSGAWPLLDGFVRLELDEQLAEAASGMRVRRTAGAGGRGGPCKGKRSVFPGTATGPQRGAAAVMESAVSRPGGALRVG